MEQDRGRRAGILDSRVSVSPGAPGVTPSSLHPGATGLTCACQVSPFADVLQAASGRCSNAIACCPLDSCFADCAQFRKLQLGSLCWSFVTSGECDCQANVWGLGSDEALGAVMKWFKDAGQCEACGFSLRSHGSWPYIGDFCGFEQDTG